MNSFGPRPPPHRLVEIAMVISLAVWLQTSILLTLPLRGQHKIRNWIARVCTLAMLIEMLVLIHDIR